MPALGAGSSLGLPSSQHILGQGWDVRCPASGGVGAPPRQAKQVAPTPLDGSRSELWTELLETLDGQPSPQRSGKLFDRLSGIHASLQV